MAQWQFKEDSKEQVVDETKSKNKTWKFKEDSKEEEIDNDQFLKETKPTIIDDISSTVSDIADDPMQALKSAGQSGLETLGEFGEALDRPRRALVEGAIEGWQEGRGLEAPLRAAGKGLYNTGQYLVGTTPFVDPEDRYVPSDDSELMKKAGLYGPGGAISERDPNLGEQIGFGLLTDPSFGPKAIFKGAKLLGKGTLGAAKRIPGIKHPAIISEGVAKGLVETKAFIDEAFAPNRQPNFDRIAKIGQRLGIDNTDLPVAVMWGKNSVRSVVERLKNQLMTKPARVKKLENNYNIAREDIVRQARSYGEVDNFHDLGNLIKTRIKDAEHNMWKMDEPTYNKIAENLELSQLPDFTNAFSEVMREIGLAKQSFTSMDLTQSGAKLNQDVAETLGFFKSKLTEILKHKKPIYDPRTQMKVVQEISREPRVYDMIRAMKSIGAELDSINISRNSNSMTLAESHLTDRFLKMYNILKESVYESVKRKDLDLGMALEENNILQKEFMDQINRVLGKKQADDIANTQIAQKFLNNVVIKGPEAGELVFGFDITGSLKSSWLMDKIIKPSVINDETQEFSVKSMASLLKQPQNKEVIKVLFRDDPDALSNIFDNARFLDALGPLYFNGSNTAIAQTIMSLTKATKDIVSLNVLENYLSESAKRHTIPARMMDTVVQVGKKAYKPFLGGDAFALRKPNVSNWEAIYPSMRLIARTKEQIEKERQGYPMSLNVPPEAAPQFARIIQNDKKLSTKERLQRLKDLKNGYFVFLVDDENNQDKIEDEEYENLYESEDRPKRKPRLKEYDIKGG